MVKLRDKFKEAVTSAIDIIRPDGGKLPSMRDGEIDERLRVTDLMATLSKYREGKSAHDERIIENDRWYRSQHWDVMREKSGKSKNHSDPEPTTGYVWNTIANKHGDLMDNYPEPVFMEREQSDLEEAEKLSKIVKYVLDRNKFRKVYSDNAWYKLKTGTAAYHVFWDPSLEGGLGDISHKKVDMLRLYWQPGVTNIQDSKYVFALSLIDKDDAKRMYPEYDGKESNTVTRGVDIRQYVQTDEIDLTDKVTMIDCYYKERQPDGSTILHMDKIIGSKIVDSTKRREKTDAGSGVQASGLYDHGKFPFVIDAMYPEEDNLLGFGLVDVVKNPQMYIDKLDQLLTKNALVAGKQRVIYKQGLFNAQDLADLSKDFIPATGSLQKGVDWDYLQANALPASILSHRSNKIAELKEISGSNDFNRGSTGGGVTSATGILALQEAGNKLSRAIITGTYDAFTEICYMTMELIAQFYTEPRKFRITNDRGQAEYVEYSNENLKPQPIPSVVQGMEQETRRPIFDIVVHAEKYSPYLALAQNQTAKDLFASGFFSPESAPAALTALSLMSFDGKDRIEKKIQEVYQQQMEMQQATNQAQQAVAQQEEMLVMMNDYIKQLTGKDMLEGSTIGQAKPGAGGVLQ